MKDNAFQVKKRSGENRPFLIKDDADRVHPVAQASVLATGLATSLFKGKFVDHAGEAAFPRM